MKTRLLIVLCGLLCWTGESWAQTNGVPAARPRGLTAQQALAGNGAGFGVGAAASVGATNDIVPLITFNPNSTLLEVITNLAAQAHVKMNLGPALMTNGAPTGALLEPIGNLQYERASFNQALDDVLAKHGLALNVNHADGGNTALLVPRAAGDEGVDLATKQPGDDEEASFAFDPNREMPLLTAIQVLGHLSHVNVMIDPRLKTGMTRANGTNPPVVIAPVATNTVILSAYGGVTARQTLDAVLDNYGLTAITNPKTGFTQVTYKDPASREPVYTYVLPLQYSNPTNVVDLIMSTIPTARVRADVRTARLVVLATQTDYEAITNLVASLDTPTKQVLIEAKFLETFHNPKSLKGVNWADTLQQQRFTMGNGSLIGGNRNTTVSQNPAPGAQNTISLPGGASTLAQVPGAPTTSQNIKNTEGTLDSTTVSLTSAGGFNPNVAFLNAQGVNAFLSALNTESDSRVLATPRAVTLDNMETKLEVTRSIPIFDASEGIGQGGTTVSSSKPNYTNVGTILVVRPRISGTNVALDVRPEISRVEPTPSRKVVAGKINEADIFATSRIQAQVMVPSGNTLVMGGLISDSTQKGYTKVPLLGDIPGLGWAFRHESNERSKANLIIFITPTIIEDEDFQPTRTDFLNTPIPQADDSPISVWDRGRPWNWKKKKSDKLDPTRQ